MGFIVTRMLKNARFFCWTTACGWSSKSTNHCVITADSHTAWEQIIPEMKGTAFFILHPWERKKTGTLLMNFWRTFPGSFVCFLQYNIFKIFSVQLMKKGNKHSPTASSPKINCSVLVQLSLGKKHQVQPGLSYVQKWTSSVEAFLKAQAAWRKDHLVYSWTYFLKCIFLVCFHTLMSVVFISTTENACFYLAARRRVKVLRTIK